MIRMMARTQEAEVPCPGCAVVSNRVHSTYRRSLADTPVGDRPVWIELTAAAVLRERSLFAAYFRRTGRRPDRSL
ncbi:transposase family protein [Streptomyces sp. NPDC056930]|uniref:transposase family protein n=1 Tax=Streptomyces sp. NPDC056930 TaxID=3345967 RepID=UPI003628F81E